MNWWQSRISSLASHHLLLMLTWLSEWMDLLNISLVWMVSCKETWHMMKWGGIHPLQAGESNLNGEYCNCYLIVHIKTFFVCWWVSEH